MEVVWVQDATESHLESSWSDLGDVVTSIESQLSKSYHNTRFAFASFADSRVSGSGADIYCYRFYRPLSSDIKDTIRSWSECKKEEALYGNGRASMSGVVESVMDPHLTWTRDSVSSSELQVVRIIIVTTNTPSLSGEVGEISESKEEGSPELERKDVDSCSITSPSLETVKNVLDEQDTHLLALVDDHGLTNWEQPKKVLKERLTVRPLSRANRKLDAADAVYHLVEKIRCSAPEQNTHHVGISAYSSGNEGRCLEEKNMSVELVWAEDGTYTASYWQGARTAFSGFFKALQKRGTGIRGAMTTFVDYGIREKSPVECYYFFRGLSSNLDDSLRSFKDFKFKNGLSDDDESAMSGILLSATDKRMGWSGGLQDNSGKRVVRIIVVYTDHGSILEGMLPKQPKWKGDGTDTCKNDAPSLQIAKKILDEKNIHVVAFIAPAGVKKWEGFKKVLGDRLIVHKATLAGTRIVLTSMVVPNNCSCVS